MLPNLDIHEHLMFERQQELLWEMAQLRLEPGGKQVMYDQSNAL